MTRLGSTAVALCALALGLAGCATPSANLESPAEVPAVTEGSEFTVEDVSITGAGGLAVVGTTMMPGSFSRAALLLHMLGGDRSEWDTLGRRLAGEGVAVLAIDLRGHGDTGGSRDWDLAAEDIELVIDWLWAGTGAPVSLIGGSIGANLAMTVGAEVVEVTGVVALSPGLEYSGVLTEPAVAGLAGRPVLMAAARGDGYAFRSTQELSKYIPDALFFEYPDASHGTDMLGAHPELIDVIVDWMGT